VFLHVGLLFDEPPDRAGLSFTKSSDYFTAYSTHISGLSILKSFFHKRS